MMTTKIMSTIATVPLTITRATRIATIIIRKHTITGII